MRLEQLKLGVLSPFGDYLSVVTAKEVGTIPTSHLSLFKDFCACGSDMIVRLQPESGSITALTCCNPQCYLKLKFQLAALFERFGFKGIGPETCGKVVNELWRSKGSVSLFEVLCETAGCTVLSGADEVAFFEALEHVRASRVSYGKFVSNLAYPFIGNKFGDVLQGISSTSELVATMKDEGGFIPFFSKRGVQSVDTIFHFMWFLKELDKITECFSSCIVESSMNIIPICMTGIMQSFDRKLTKSQYLEVCNSIFVKEDGSKIADLVSTETVSKALFVVVGQDSIEKSTSKFRKALDHEASLRKAGIISDSDKFWYTPEEFLYLLHARAGEKDE